MENNLELINQSENIRLLASRLIIEKRVLEVLNELGNPLLIGSYELDLMIDEDIDIVLQTKNPKESAKKALENFIELEGFQKYQYGDFVSYPRKNRPVGYIVNLIVEFENINWEIEIWFFEDISSYRKQLDNYKKEMTFDKKVEILKRKNKRKKIGLKKDDANYENSVEIYNAVLFNKEL